MLNIARLLFKTDSVPTYYRPTLPTRPTCENISRSAANPRLARANPTLPTRPTENTIHATSNNGGAETPLSVAAGELLHPRACPGWWKECLAGCKWYHTDTGGDFCWKCDCEWWKTPWPGEEDEEPLMLAQETQGGDDERSARRENGQW